MASQDERVEGAIREARIRQGEGQAPMLGQTISHEGIFRMPTSF